jgi:hypothetical protein
MMNLLNDPLMALGAGLLDPNGTYGSFGAALNKGLLAGQQAQRMSQNAAFQKMQMEAYKQAQEREREKQKRIEALQARYSSGGMLGKPASPVTTPSGAFRGSLLHNQTPATGMHAEAPRMAGLLGGLAQIDPMAALQAEIGMMKPQEPTSAIQNYAALIKMGYPEDVALDRAFSGGVNVTVGTGDKPIPVGDLNKLTIPGVGQVPYGTTPEQAVAMGAQTSQQPTESEAKGMAQTDIAMDDLNTLEALMTGKLPKEDGSGLYDIPEIGPTEAGMFKLANKPFIGSAVQKYGPEMSQGEAKLISVTTSLSNQLLAAMRGAQVGPAEQERFELQLPVPGQPNELFMENLRNTKRNLAELDKRKRQYRNINSGAINRNPSGPPPGFTVPMP